MQAPVTLIQPRLERVQNSAGHEQVAQAALVTVQRGVGHGPADWAVGPGEWLETEQEPVPSCSRPGGRRLLAGSWASPQKRTLEPSGLWPWPEELSFFMRPQKGSISPATSSLLTTPHMSHPLVLEAHTTYLDFKVIQCICLCFGYG